MKEKIYAAALELLFIGIIGALAVMFYGLLAGQAGAATCRSVNGHCFKQAAVVHHAPVVAAPVYYQIGQGLQQEAVATHNFRQSEEYIELQQLRGYRAGVEAALQAGSRPPLQPEQGQPPATEEGLIEQPPVFSAPEPPQYFEESTGRPISPEQVERMRANAEAARNGHPVKREPFAAAHPTLAANCAKCHANAESKGGFGIADDVTAAKAAGDCEQLLAIVDSIATGRMPKGATMTEAERLQAISELLSQ